MSSVASAAFSVRSVRPFEHGRRLCLIVLVLFFGLDLRGLDWILRGLDWIVGLGGLITCMFDLLACLSWQSRFRLDGERWHCVREWICGSGVCVCE